jgi:hypothetical protein
MSSWRDFALRGFIRALRPMGQVVPDEFAEPFSGFARTKG